MRLESLTRPELIFPELEAGDRPAVLRSLADRLAAKGLVPNGERLFQRLTEREGLGSTGIGCGVAIPHCKLEGLAAPLLVIGILRQAIDYGAVDGRPVQLVFLVVSPTEAPAEHLQILAAISRWVRVDHHVERILASTDRQEILDLLKERT